MLFFCIYFFKIVNVEMPSAKTGPSHASQGLEALVSRRLRSLF